MNNLAKMEAVNDTQLEIGRVGQEIGTKNLTLNGLQW